MATAVRKQKPTVNINLFTEPYTFEFAQAVRILETLNPQRERLGASPYSRFESVQIKSNIRLSLPPSDIYALTPDPTHPSKAPYLTVNFIGIAGQTGPLPNIYGELVLDRTRRGDTAFRDFLDTFNHRIAAIHYRISVKHTLTLAYDQPHQSEAGQILLCFSGLTPFSDDRQELLPRRCFIKYAGLLWHHPPSATGLEVYLADLFNLPVTAEQFVGQWYYLEPHIITHLGDTKLAASQKQTLAGQYNTLGRDAALGKRVWLNSVHMTLKFQDLPLKEYIALLPPNTLNKRVADAVQIYAGTEHQFDFYLSLKPGAEVPVKLDGRSHLGWTSWLAGASRKFVPQPIKVAANTSPS